jgi:hypothetical protein
MLEIQLMFNGMNRGCNFDSTYLAKYCLDDYLRVPLTDESIAIPADLLSALFGVVSGFKGMNKG